MKALANLVRGIVREGNLPALDDGTLVLPPREVEPVRRARFETKWHVYAKAPFEWANQVLAYLGRYTHRVGISNARFSNYDGEAVPVGTKDGLSCTLHAVNIAPRGDQGRLPAVEVPARSPNPRLRLVRPRSLTSGVDRQSSLPAARQAPGPSLSSARCALRCLTNTVGRHR